MHEFELHYIEARAKVRAALDTLREMSEIYMEMTRRTMLAYFALHYPDLQVEIVASMRNKTYAHSFDYTLHFEFIYPGLSPEQSRPFTREVWDYIQTLDMPLLGTTHDTAPDTSGGGEKDLVGVQLE